MDTKILAGFTIKDKYEYNFPYGHWAEPQIRVLSGPYKGLIFDVMCSGLGKYSDKDTTTFTYTYKILKTWDHSCGEATDKDKEYIGKLVLNLIQMENKCPTLHTK